MPQLNPTLKHLLVLLRRLIPYFIVYKYLLFPTVFPTALELILCFQALHVVNVQMDII